MTTKALDILVEHFNKNGWPIHVSEEKLFKRAGMADCVDKPLCKIIEIERHRPILGMQYTKGLPMASYETYFMRYMVDISNATVEELHERVGESTIDLSAIVESNLSKEEFDLSIQPVGDGRYAIKEHVSHMECVASSYDDVLDFVMSFTKGYVEFFRISIECEAGCSRDQIPALIHSYQKTLESELEDQAKSIWKVRDRDSDLCE